MRFLPHLTSAFLCVLCAFALKVFSFTAQIPAAQFRHFWSRFSRGFASLIPAAQFD
jgi:hypothetical protein